MNQKTFGKTKIIDVENTKTKCKCGNNSVVVIQNPDENNHYCRKCARYSWLKMRKKYE